VRRSDDPDVHLPRAPLPHAPQLAFLEHAKEAALHGGARIPDLVQEERSTVCELEESQPVGVRAGERAARVAEELALDQRVGNGGEVVRKEWALARGLVWWSARAISSFPVPVSPCTKTVAGLGARAAMRTPRSRRGRLHPARPRVPA
jgi:hypothetical protein